MRNPKFKSIEPNYKKNVLEVTLREGQKLTSYNLPFAVFRGQDISSKNKFKVIKIHKELRHQGASFILEDGSYGDFPSDFVLYHCDPTYDWSPLNQLKRSLKEKVKNSRISLRVLADALDTSPTQVVRLFEENKASKQLTQLFQVAELAGYQIEISLKKKSAA